MKLIYYPPAFVLSQIYAYTLEKKYKALSPRIDSSSWKRVLQIVKNHMLSPRRNGYLDLNKNLIAAYFVTPSDIVIDAGAHVGRFTQFLANLVGKKGKVHAYEAHPQIFQELQKRLKRLPQVQAHPLAISNQSDKPVKMNIYPGEISRESATLELSLMNAERMPGKTQLIDVDCQKLDIHAEESPPGKCSLIKMDVEGHEHAAIDGAKLTLRKHRPILIYEYGYEPKKFEPQTIAQLMDLDYTSYDCRILESVPPRYIAQTPTDLAAVPNERVSEFEQLVSVLKNNFAK